MNGCRARAHSMKGERGERGETRVAEEKGTCLLGSMISWLVSIEFGIKARYLREKKRVRKEKKEKIKIDFKIMYTWLIYV